MIRAPLQLSQAEYQACLRRDLMTFIERTFLELHPATPWQGNWHIELIASKLMDVVGGKTKRLVINIPPRSLKSLCASIAFPAWLLGNYPGKQIICASYGQDLANNLAAACRTVMLRPWYQKTFQQMQFSSRTALHDFGTTMNGGRLAVSTGGGITGRGADILIIDDPLKSL